MTDHDRPGEGSAALDAAVADRHGWLGDTAESLGQQRTDREWSRWNLVSNRQDLGLQATESMAAHAETPTAALDVEPF